MQTCTIQIHLDEDEIVYYNPWQIGYITVQQIAFGFRSSSCIFIPKENLNHELELSGAICEKLFLQPETKIHLLQNANTFYLGPLLGIFTTGCIEENLNEPFGERTFYFQKLLHLQKQAHSVAFIFGPQHIHWKEEFIDGYFYENEKWTMKKIGFPSIIYDRLPNRKVERARPIIHIKNKLQKEYGVPFFNPGFFRKSEIFEKLARHSMTATYLPETVSQPTFAQVFEFLHTHKFAYLKPEDESFGTGIIKCFYHRGTKLYYASFYQDNQRTMRSFDRLETLLEVTLEHRHLSDYIIQSGIPLLQHHGCPFDFRVHTNRDKNGKWQISAVAVKIAAKGAPTTHTKYGGEIQILEKLDFSHQTKRKWREMIDTAVLQMSEVIEKEYEGIIGEIGFDIGIDQNEKLWVFEGNAKPGRSIFQHPILSELEQENLAYTYLFSYYLMEQTIKHSPEFYDIYSK